MAEVSQFSEIYVALFGLRLTVLRLHDQRRKIPRPQIWNRSARQPQVYSGGRLGAKREVKSECNG